MAQSPLLTTAQVALRADVHPRTVARWVADGRLEPAHRLPGKTGALLFSAAAVDRFLAKGTRLQRMAS